MLLVADAGNTSLVKGQVLSEKEYREYIEKYGEKEAYSRIYATTDAKKGALHDEAVAAGYTRFVVPDNIGGRYSVLTAVGLLPMAVAGVDIDKTYPYIFLMRGEQFLKQGKRDLACSDFNEILKLDTIAESGSCRHYALLFLDKKDEALEWMEKIISTDTKNKGSYYDKACLMSHMGKLEDAIAALRLSLEKGFRSFAHIDHDDDMDTIRNLPEFIALIEEYKAKPKVVIEDVGSDTGTGLVTEVQMKKMYSGVYEVPCTINRLELKFIFDTGASDVTISSVEASFITKISAISVISGLLS